MGKTAVCVRDLCKAFHTGNEIVQVLKNLDFDVSEGEFAAISGASGSGKTTLLNLIGGIDRPTSGKVFVFGNDLVERDEDWLADFRCTSIGYVFQAYNLVSTLTVAENIAFPMEWMRKTVVEIEHRVKELLQSMNLQNRANHFPSQMSGGEQQRVAFARALANDPPLLLVDEPTGNLDVKTSQNVILILRKLVDSGKTIVLATHDERILKLSDATLSLEAGKLVRVNG